MLKYTKNPQVEQINLRIFRTPLVFLLAEDIYRLKTKRAVHVNLFSATVFFREYVAVYLLRIV